MIKRDRFDENKLKSMLISESVTIKQAMQKLNETAERVLFVVDKKNRLLGTVTDGDIRRAIIDGRKFSDKIGLVMHRDFIAVRSGIADIEEHVKTLMVETEIEQIPVLNNFGIIEDVFLWTDMLGSKEKIIPKKQYENQVVIMAGGKGSRLDPFTKILPKPLIPLGNKPVIEVILERFFLYGMHKFLYTLNYKKEFIKLFLKDNEYPYEIEWVEEDDFLGTAGGLRLLKDKLKETFFVTNCDSVLDVDFEQVLLWHLENKSAITIIGCHNEVKIPFGVLEMSGGRLDKIKEKPVHDVVINTGVYVMEPHIIQYIPRNRLFDMNELIDIIINREKVSVYPIYDGWLDIGQWEEYNKSVEKFNIS
jgi:dTDP-glucose pyrophosphorylase